MRRGLSFQVLCLATLAVLAVTCLSTASAAASASASAYGGRGAVERGRVAAPAGWRRVGPADPDVWVDVHIFLHQQNTDKLEATLLDVSDPKSPNYGKYWSAERVNALVAPANATVDAVVEWLVAENRISPDQIDTSDNRDIFKVKIPVAVASRLLNATFDKFIFDETDETVVRALNYTVPAKLLQHIDFIGPAIRFPTPTAPRASPMPSSNSVFPSASTGQRTGKRTLRDRVGLRDSPTSSSSAPAHRATSGPVDLATQIRSWQRETLTGTSELVNTGVSAAVRARRSNRARTAVSASAPVSALHTRAVRAPAAALDKSADGSVRMRDGDDDDDKSPLPVPSDETALPTMTPELLKHIYKLDDQEHRATNPATSVAVAGFLNQFMNHRDLKNFSRVYDPASKDRTFKIVGTHDESRPGPEANLDAQYLMTMAPGVQNLVYWSTIGDQPGGPKGNEPFLEFLYDVASDPHPPAIFSISYGENEDTVNLEYATRVNIEFQKGGLRGITFLVASGDGGVSGGRPAACEAFNPTYPAASPWVTTVGGTTGVEPEFVAGLSSGGFSNRWARPAYQSEAVETYFATVDPALLPPPDRYNRTGAAFPDISASALRFPIVLNGSVAVLDGTSAATPVVAGLVALLNDVRASAGKGPLGYLNPLLYQNPGAFNDIVDGSNPGCGTDGFHATKGWDPATGLGTPNFPLLKQVVQALP